MSSLQDGGPTGGVRAGPAQAACRPQQGQLFPIDCDVAYRASSQFGMVVRVAKFNRVTVQVSFAFFILFFFRTFRAVALSVHLMLLLQVMVEYETLEQAVSAKEELHGSNLYKDCCALRVKFCMKEKVDVKQNNVMVSWRNFVNFVLALLLPLVLSSSVHIDYRLPQRKDYYYYKLTRNKFWKQIIKHVLEELCELCASSAAAASVIFQCT